MTERIRKDFDVTSGHLPAHGHHVTRKARGFQEANRRRGLGPGMLIIEKEQQGLSVAANILTIINDPISREFATRLLGATVFNGAWYHSAQGAHRASIDESVGRRRAKLPDLTAEGDDWRPNSDSLLVSSAERLQIASDWGGKLLTGMETKGSKTREKAFGKYLADTSLVIASVEIGDYTATARPAEAQHLAWRSGLEMVNNARSLGEEIGSHPSPAQLADPDSDLLVFWRRNAPDGAYAALPRALQMAGIAA
jgi:hypothetical protein